MDLGDVCMCHFVSQCSLHSPQVQNTQQNHKTIIMFLLCVVESQNMKDEALKPHHGDKPHKHEKIKTLLNFLNYKL
jgi:hypothetical protein